MTTVDDVQLGQLVISKAGRDKDRFYLVANILDNSFIMVVDGDVKTMKNPKRKNIKHVQPTNHVVDQIGEKLLAGKKVSDEEIKRVIWELSSQSRRSLE